MVSTIYHPPEGIESRQRKEELEWIRTGGFIDQVQARRPCFDLEFLTRLILPVKSPVPASCGRAKHYIGLAHDHSRQLGCALEVRLGFRLGLDESLIHSLWLSK